MFDLYLQEYNFLNEEMSIIISQYRLHRLDGFDNVTEIYD